MPGCSACNERKLNTEADEDTDHEYGYEEFERSKAPQGSVRSVKEEDEKSIGYSQRTASS